MSGEPVTTQDLQKLREGHIGRLLLQAHRAFSDRAVSKLRQRGYSELTLAHIALLPHVDVEGTRITTLAERAGMTKQGMGQIVHDLERHGYLEREPDPSDRRAYLVRFSETGNRFLTDALAVISELEAEYEAILGADGLENLRTALAMLHEYERA